MEKIKSLAWYLQLALFAVIAGVLYLGVWYFFTSGMHAEVAELNDQIAQQEQKNQAAQIATQRINEFRSLYASKSQEYDEIKVLLPEQREITNVLQGLQNTASENRLIVRRFSPRDDSQSDSIMAKPVEIEVDSNYANLNSFFDKMAKLPRIVSITDFNLTQVDKQSAEQTLHARFLLTAYYATPENLASAAPQNAPAKPGQSNGQPNDAPAAAAPAAK
jgi:type IV pilus assembly protein PilO